MSAADDDTTADIQERKEENDELQDTEQFERSEEFVNQGFKYGQPLDDDPEHLYSEGSPEGDVVAETEAEADLEQAGGKARAGKPASRSRPQTPQS
jgi:hypothetical protein